jgi:K+-transporting ATPase ATPase C chain
MNYGKLIAACAVLTALTVVVCGIAYPLATWAIANVVFPQGAGGSPVSYNGTIVGSKLIGQNFEGPEYFHSRPSAVDYNASASGASNLGPGNPVLIELVRERMANGAEAPDAVSVDNAMAQASRVAIANGLGKAEVIGLISRHTQGRFLIWGEPRVNVLELNLAVLELKKGKV